MGNAPVNKTKRENDEAVCQLHPGFEKVKAAGVDLFSTAICFIKGVLGSLPVALARALRCDAAANQVPRQSRRCAAIQVDMAMTRCQMLTHHALPPPAAQAGEVAAAATVALANSWKAGGCPDAQVLIFVDGEKRNILKEKRGGTKAAEEEGAEAAVDPDTEDPDMEEPDPVDEAAAAPDADGYTSLLAHHLGELAKRADCSGLHVVSCPGDAENGVAALCTMLREESMGSSLDADSSVFAVASQVIMQATLLKASHARRQTWNVRELFRRMRKGEPAMEHQLVAQGVGAVEGDYYQDYVVKDFTHGPKTRLDAVIAADAAMRRALAASFLSGVPPTLLDVVRTWITKLVAALKRSGVKLEHEDGTPYTPQEQDEHTRAVLAAQLLRLTVAPTRAWCDALRAGVVLPLDAEVVFIVPDLRGRWWEDGAEWLDDVLPARGVLAELRKPENADLKGYLDKFHSAFGGVEAEEEELRRRNCRPTPLAVPPAGPSRTLAELAAVVPAIILAAVSPGCDLPAPVSPPYVMPGGVWGKYGYPDLDMPGVTADYTVGRMAAVQAASIRSAVTAVERFCCMHDPERGLEANAFGPECHVSVYKTATLLLEPRFSGRNVLVFADHEAKALLVISVAPDADDDAIYEVLLNRTYADLMSSKHRVRCTPTPDAASAVFAMGGPLRKHPLRLDPPLHRGKKLNATALYRELSQRQPMLMDLARVLDTSGKEGWPAEGAATSNEAAWIVAATPPAGAAPLRQVGELIVRLSAEERDDPARVQAAEAALVAVVARRTAVAAAHAAAAHAQAQAQVEALQQCDAGRLHMRLAELSAASSAACYHKRRDLADHGKKAETEAKRRRKTDVSSALAVVDAALAVLRAGLAGGDAA